MRISIFLFFSTLALAVPPPIPDPKPTSSTEQSDRHIVQARHHWPVYSGSSLERRQGLCNWNGYCKSAYTGCIKQCASLTNGDW